MSSEIKSKVENLKNPATGKTFLEEGRILELKLSDDELILKYKRDGISPEEKRVIETNILDAVKEKYKSEQVTILTVSDNASKDVTSCSKGDACCSSGHGHDHGHEHGGHCHDERPAAALQVGHGPAGATKKRVPNVKKVLAVSSCKGGVGKSTVAVNLAFGLKKLGLKVGLLDADIYGPSLPMLLNQREAKPVANENKKIVPIDAYGLPFMSFGLFVGENDPVIWRGPMLGGVLNQFLFDVEWGNLDYLIIDLPPGTGDMQLSMVQATDVDGAVVVSTPQSVALLDSKKGLNMFHQIKVPVLGMIENMSFFTPDDNPTKKYYIFGEGGVKKACDELQTELLAEIPLEIIVREGSDNGNPYMNNPQFEGKPVWNAYMDLATNVHKKLFPETEKKGFFKKLFS